MLKETNEGVILAVKVTPKCNKSEINGIENDELKVRLAAVPEEGKANNELIRFLSRLLKIPKSHLVIISGEQSRHKRVLIKEMTKDTLLSKLDTNLTL